MHECPECGQACDCDGEDLWYEFGGAAMILAIDPGPIESAYVILADDGTIRDGMKRRNCELLAILTRFQLSDTAVCERIRSYGMPAGAELFETCEWCGRFQQAWVSQSLRHQWEWMLRKDIKLHLCGNSRAKDANIRQALIDRYGGKAAIGKKEQPGPLYGVSGDVWAALAVAVTWADQHSQMRLGGAA